MKVKSEEHAAYAAPQRDTKEDDAVIAAALEIVASRFVRGEAFSDPKRVGQYLSLELAGEKDEVFGAMFMDAQHRLLAKEILFRGTVDGATVPARPIVRRALDLNAAAVIFFHNHPSGSITPSKADITLTNSLKDILGKLDIRVLDHIIVGGADSSSFAEKGLL